MSRFNDITGKKFGRLTAITPIMENGRRRKWRCLCDCGKETIVLSYNLKNGNTQSCGCQRDENRFNPNKYDLNGEFGKCFFESGDFFIFDLEDYEKLKEYTWCKGRSGGYAIASKNGVHVSAHRLIMDCPKGLIIDHINHDTWDNRKINLRICTIAENNLNKLPRKNRYTNKTGVRFDGKKWRAYIAKDNVDYSLGAFKTEMEAIKARKEAEVKFFGEFAYKEV